MLFKMGRGCHPQWCAWALLLSSLPTALSAQELEEVPYVPEAQCAEVLEELVAAEAPNDAELNFATNVCYASRLLDFRLRTQEDIEPSDNGATRSLPKPNDPDVESSTALDRQINTATATSVESWDELAQGDPQAAYDLLKRLIGEQDATN